MRRGAHVDPHSTTFVAFTTRAKDVRVKLYSAPGQVRREERMEEIEPGTFAVRLAGEVEGALYAFAVDGEETPDPFARYLPFGVHGPAMVMAARQAEPLSPPRPFEGWTIYELHVGAFTPEGTWLAAIEKLDHLKHLGIDAIELLPVAAFDGARGWGYDGVAAFAPHAAYGTPDDLRTFVSEAHQRGIAVILDVVYNHFGPAGNYLWRYSEGYFDKSIETPWGAAPAYGHAPMRSLALENARYWLEEFGFDGLRLDATHEVHDKSERHVLRELSDLAHSLGRRVFFEDERNEPAVVTELGADAVWADDFHHQVHVLLTGETDGYYAAYAPTVEALAQTIQKGFGYTGEPYAPWKGRPRGKPARDLVRPAQFVYCLQNHDQVGNRARGSRLSHDADLDSFTAASALLLFLPQAALIFMGQEWATESPFLFFSDHSGDLGEAVSKGRKSEFASFASFAGDVPDPQEESTFVQSKLDWSELGREPHDRVLALYRSLLRLRRDDAVLAGPARFDDLQVVARGDVLEVIRRRGDDKRRLYVNFGNEPAAIDANGKLLLVTLPLVGTSIAPKSAVIFG